MSDLIDRQAAIDAMAELQGRASSKGELTGISKAWKRIKKLPPIQPETHEGHWIPHESPDGGVQYECSRCGVLWEFNDGTPEDNEAYFCPKCGKKLITK